MISQPSSGCTVHLNVYNWRNAPLRKDWLHRRKINMFPFELSYILLSTGQIYPNSLFGVIKPPRSVSDRLEQSVWIFSGPVQRPTVPREEHSKATGITFPFNPRRRSPSSQHSHEANENRAILLHKHSYQTKLIPPTTPARFARQCVQEWKSGTFNQIFHSSPQNVERKLHN